MKDKDKKKQIEDEEQEKLIKELDELLKQVSEESGVDVKDIKVVNLTGPLLHNKPLSIFIEFIITMLLYFTFNTFFHVVLAPIYITLCIFALGFIFEKIFNWYLSRRFFFKGFMRNLLLKYIVNILVYVASIYIIKIFYSFEVLIGLYILMVFIVRAIRSFVLIYLKKIKIRKVM